MYVTAFSSPGYLKWRWRITDVNGAVLEESDRTFETITLAVAGGTERLVSINGERPGGTGHDRRRERRW
jgi:hypothetical protein